MQRQHDPARDRETFAAAKHQLHTNVVGDVLDSLGFYDQFLRPELRPVRPDAVLIGRAMTVLEIDAPFASFEGAHNTTVAQPFGMMFEALDSLKENEVYICTGASPRFALWGELMSTRAAALGAAGAVVDGYSRDTRAVANHPLPVFSCGSYGQDQGARGKVVDYRVPIRMGNVWINPGDIVFGDIDGVVIVPQQVEDEVFAKATEKVSGENVVRDALAAGLSTVEAYKEYGIM